MVGIARHEQHLYLWPLLSKAVCQLSSAQVGHYYVGQQEVNWMFVPVCNLQGFVTVHRMQDGVTVFLKELAS